MRKKNLPCGVLFIQAILDKQKASQKARIEARKQSEANREYEEEIAMQMSKISNREMSFIQKPDPRNKQADMVWTYSLARTMGLY